VADGAGLGLHSSQHMLIDDMGPTGIPALEQHRVQVAGGPDVGIPCPNRFSGQDDGARCRDDPGFRIGGPHPVFSGRSDVDREREIGTVEVAVALDAVGIVLEHRGRRPSHHMGPTWFTARARALVNAGGPRAGAVIRDCIEPGFTPRTGRVPRVRQPTSDATPARR